MTKKKYGVNSLRLRFHHDADKVLLWRIKHLEECLGLVGKSKILNIHYRARIDECKFLLSMVDKEEGL